MGSQFGVLPPQDPAVGKVPGHLCALGRDVWSWERGRFAFECRNCRRAMRKKKINKCAGRRSADLFCISRRRVVG